jgi:hypothetical protein
LLVFASCERDANVDLPQIDPKMVVSCFITPGADWVEARVTLTDPVFGSSNQSDPYVPLAGAEVTLISGNLEMPLPFDANFQLYMATTDVFEILAGASYQLRVEHPDYPTLTSTTTVPNSYPIIHEFALLDRDSVTTSFESTIRYRTKARWSLQSGISKYYVVKHRRLVTYDEGGFQYTNTEPLADFFFDNASNEQMVEDIWTSQVPYYEGSAPPFSSVHELFVVNASEEYYRFHQTIQNISLGNPFAEPTLVYSNIEGGLGIFAGYTMQQAEFIE